MRWIIIVVIVFLASCSDDKGDVLPEKASLKVNINSKVLTAGGGTTKAGAYVRGNAPVYIEGVRIKADKMYDSSVDDVVHEFLFVENGNIGGKQVIMTGIDYGWNEVSAEGMCANDPVNFWENKKSWTTAPVEKKALNDMAADYSRIIKDTYPVYANYYSENNVQTNIRNTGSNSVSLNMITDNHRIAIVIENASDDYTLRCYIYVGNHYTYMELVDKGNCSSVVYNGTDDVGTKNCTVRIDYSGTWPISPGVKTKYFTINKGQDETRYYRFNKGVVEEGSASANISWVPLNDNTSGEDIY